MSYVVCQTEGFIWIFVTNSFSVSGCDLIVTNVLLVSGKIQTHL